MTLCQETQDVVYINLDCNANTRFIRLFSAGRKRVHPSGGLNVIWHV